MIIGEFRDTGVVEQGVDAAEGLGGGNDPHTILILRDVALNQHATGAGGLDKGLGLPRLGFT